MQIGLRRLGAGRDCHGGRLRERPRGRPRSAGTCPASRSPPGSRTMNDERRGRLPPTSGSTPRRDQLVGEARRRQHQTVIRKGVGLRSVARTRGREDCRELAIGLHAHRQRGDRMLRRRGESARGTTRPGERCLGSRPERELLVSGCGRTNCGVPSSARSEPTAGTRSERRRWPQRAGSFEASTSPPRSTMRNATTPRRRQRRLHPLPEVLGFGGATAAAPPTMCARFCSEPSGALDHDRILRDRAPPRQCARQPRRRAPSTTVPSSASRLATRVCRDRIANAVVGPVAEADQQRTDDHGRRVAPRLGLDQARR